MMEARSWTPQELRDIIFDEVTRGNTVQTLNESMRTLIDATHTSFAETMKAFEITAGRITIQERENKKAKEEIERILGDCQTFVSHVQAEQTEARAKLTLELESSRGHQQTIVKFVEALQPQVAGLEVQMTTVNEWFKDTARSSHRSNPSTRRLTPSRGTCGSSTRASTASLAYSTPQSEDCRPAREASEQARAAEIETETSSTRETTSSPTLAPSPQSSAGRSGDGTSRALSTRSA